MPFDPNTAVDISADEAVKFNPNTAQDIPTPEINIYDNDTKKVISMPSTFDEDRMQYVKQTQAFHQSQADFWGMSEVKNNMFSQIFRGLAGFGYQLPSHLRSVIKAAREEETEELKKAVEGEPVTAVTMAGMFPVAYTISPREAKRKQITNEKTVAKIDEINEQSRKIFEKSKLAKTAADGFWYDIGSGVGSLGTAVALSFVTKNPASAAILFGGIQKGSSYEELRAKGYSPEYANKVSNIAGIAEAGLEFVGLDLFMRGMKGNKIIGRFIKGAITEGTQEASQTTAEEFVMQKFGGREKEGMDTLKDIAYSALLGAIIGAPTSAILGAGMQLAQKKGISKKQSDAIINKVLSHKEIEGQAHKLFDNQNDPLTFPNADENLAVKGLDESLTEIETRKAEEAKGIKEAVKSEILEAGVDESEAEQVSDIMQARAEASASALGISPQEWLESKRLQYKGETPELSINEAIQEETLIEEIERPTEILFQQLPKDIQEQVENIDNKIKKINKKIDEERQAEFQNNREQAENKKERKKLNEATEKKYEQKQDELTSKLIREKYNLINRVVKAEKPVEKLEIKEAKPKEPFKFPKIIKEKDLKLEIDRPPMVGGVKRKETDFHWAGTDSKYFNIDLANKKTKEVVSEYKTRMSDHIQLIVPWSRSGLAGQEFPFNEFKNYSDDELFKKNFLRIEKDIYVDISKVYAMSELYAYVKDPYKTHPDRIVENKKLRYFLESIEQPDILEQPARGQIEFGPDNTIIRLFQGKDRTTLLHETGHLFLRDMQAVAEQTQDPQAMEDIQILKDFYKVKGDKFSRENEEAFADDFVGFVMSGKAPSAKLVGAFERFKQWLLSMYEKVKTRVTLTPEVKQVFDRMLGGYDVDTATSSEIKDLSTRTTELSTLADNIKAGNLKDITQAQLDEFESLINAAKQRPPAEPQSLFQWIRRRGGIWDKGGELRDMDLPAGVIRTKADSYMPNQALYNALDTTRESAIEDGFLDEGADENDLLNKISQEAKGDKQYRKVDLQRISEREQVLQDKDNAEMILSQLDINPEDILQTIRKNRAKQLKAVPTPEFAGVLSRIERLERAVGRITTEQQRLTEAQIKAITKQDIKAVQDRVIDLIKSARLEAKDRAKFIAAIKNIQTGEQLARILPSLQERIARYKETTQKANIREQIHKELKTIKPTVISGKLKGKFDAETQQALQTFKDIEKMNIETARENLQKIFDKARELQYEPNEIELKQNLWLQIQAYYASSTQSDLQEVLDFIKQLKSEARIKLFERLEREKAEREQAIETTIKAIDGSKPFDPKSIQPKKKGLFNYFNYWLHDWNTLLQKVLNNKQWAEFLAQNVENSELKEMGEWNTDNRLNKEMLMSAYNVAESELQPVYARQMDEFEFNIMGSDNQIHTRKLTRGQIIDLYTQAQNEETRGILTDPELNAFSDAELTAIFNVLSKEDIAFGNALFNRYDRAYEQLNDTFKETQGIKLGKVEKYIPRAREVTREDEDLLTQVIYQASTTPGAVKRRVRGKSQVKLINALAKLDRHIEEKNRYITHAKMLQRINAIFRNADVRAKIKGKYGSNTMQAIDAHIKSFGLEKVQDLNTFWQQLRGSFVGLKVGLSPAIFLKQLTSVAAYTEVVSPAQLASGMIDFLKSPVKNAKWLRNNSEFIKNRIDAKAFERDIKALEKSKLNKLNVFTKWNDFVTMFVRAGDIMAIYPGMWAMLKAGKTMQEAERFSNRTQQSASRSKLSLAQKGTNTDKLFTMFTSTPQQYLRKIIGSWKDWRRGDISTTEFARIQVIYTIILPAVFSAVGSAFRPDKKKKEFLQTMVTANVSGLPFISWIFSTLTAEAIGTRTFPYSFPFADEYNDVVKNGVRIMQNVFTDADKKIRWEDFITGLIETSAPFTGVGIPAKRLWNATEGIYEITAEGKTTKGLLRLGGYTDYTAEKVTGE